MLLKVKNKLTNTTKWAIFSLFFCGLMLITLFGLKIARAAFQEPSALPPEKNALNFLNSDKENQGRSGKLKLGTADISIFNYQLQVEGTAEINDLLINDTLAVDTDTLYVDNAKNSVGINTNSPSTKLSVNGSMSIENASVGLLGISQSTDNNVIYGQSTSTNFAGVYGRNDSVGGYGVAGVNNLTQTSSDGRAIRGEGVSGIAIYGRSDSGIAIYGTNANPLGLWAGYFEGRIESTGEIIGAKFMNTNPPASLIPYTVGMVLDTFAYTNIQVKYFDGTYLWAVDEDKLYKIRAADGFLVDVRTVGNGLVDVLFNKNIAWALSASDNNIYLVDLNEAIQGLINLSFSPVDIVFDGQSYWVIGNTADGDGKVAQIITTKGGATVKATDSLTNNDPLKKIIFNGNFLWVLSNYTVININPSTRQAVGYTGITGQQPQDIFYDNYYYWVANKDNDNVTKFYLTDNKVCSENPGRACLTDDDCGVGEGSCFAVPASVGNYQVGDGPEYLAFDGTYLWTANTNTPSLSRLLAADPQQKQDFSLAAVPTSLAFDGTYLYISASNEISKIYSGTGYGLTDLNRVLTLQTSGPLISQTGSINITGDGVNGGNLTVSGNIVVQNNQWGGSEDQVIQITPNGNANCGGTTNCFNCPNGYFIKRVDKTDNAIDKIYCRPL